MGTPTTSLKLCECSPTCSSCKGCREDCLCEDHADGSCYRMKQRRLCEVSVEESHLQEMMATLKYAPLAKALKTPHSLREHIDRDMASLLQDLGSERAHSNHHITIQGRDTIRRLDGVAVSKEKVTSAEDELLPSPHYQSALESAQATLAACYARIKESSTIQSRSTHNGFSGPGGVTQGSPTDFILMPPSSENAVRVCLSVCYILTVKHVRDG